MACGHSEYWPQFPGMKEQLLENVEVFAGIVRDGGAELVGCEFVDTLEMANNVGVEFKKKDIDLLFVYLTTYVASGRYLQGALRAECPIVIVGLQRPVNLDDEITLQRMTGSGGPCQMPEAM